MNAASSDKPEAAPRFVIVAGEASGDTLGAGLISALAERYPQASFQGIGGEAMAAAGCENWWDIESLSVMGLAEVLRHLPRLMKLKRELIQRTVAASPDVFIGVDSPDFNLRVSRALRHAGIPTVQYVCPTVWAWRPRRVKTIARSADRVLCLYPFEPEYLSRHGIAADFVGHPLADRLQPDPKRDSPRRTSGAAPGAPLIALLPGSRSGEVSRIGPLLAESAAQLVQNHTEARFTAAMANAATRNLFESQLSAAGIEASRVQWASDARTALHACDFAIAASGTVTLEAALIGRPVIVVYRVAPLSHFLLKTLGLLKLKHVALPNILCQDEVVPELLQRDATPQRVCRIANQWLQSPTTRAAIEQRFSELHQQLAKDADHTAADAISAMIEGQ